jgi:hypothetical protein
MAAEKSTPTPAPEAEMADAAESAVKVFEDVVSKAQAQYLTMMTEAQNIALDAYRSMFDGVAKLNLPTIPGFASMGQVPANMVDNAFAFGEAVLGSQREFAKKLFEVSAV